MDFDSEAVEEAGAVSAEGAAAASEAEGEEAAGTKSVSDEPTRIG